MKVLQLCHKPPFPPIDGGCKAMNNISRGFINNNVDLKILSIHTHKHPFNANNIPKEYHRDTGIESIYVDTKLNVVDALSNLITQDSYNISRFFSPDFDLKLIEVLEENSFDVIHLESLFMTPYMGTIRRLTNAPIVLRSHNLEFVIWERMAHAAANKAKKTYLKVLASQLKKYEKQVLKEIDAIVSITHEDTQRFKKLGCKKPVITIPFGIDFNHYNPDLSKTQENTVFHLGAMDWLPNIEGLDWFLEQVWPKIFSHNPDLSFHIAGKNMPKNYITDLNNGLVIEGEVESAREFINSKSIMVVPLLSAGGMRVKIIEGMAMGKIIVSTSVGAEGIDYENKKHLFIADSPKEFTQVINKLMANPELVQSVGNNARELIQEKYDNNKLSADLIRFYEELIRENIKQKRLVNKSS